MKQEKNLPKGFYFFSVAAGIKTKQRSDMALFYSHDTCTAGALFTTNRVQAASVQTSRKHLRGGSIQAIIANSGCANACTGKQGLRDAEYMCEEAALSLGLRPSQVLVASTGVIGKYLPMRKIGAGIRKLCATLLKTPFLSSAAGAAEAIMTTDTVRKTSSAVISLGGREVRIWACAKGSGMIHPDMATFLCFIFTDCAITRKMLDSSLRAAAAKSFNVMSVDGDTSTNDTVAVLANGSAGNKRIEAENAHYRKFSAALNEICLDIAKQVVADGEGATKCITIRIQHAMNNREAAAVARSIATSPLVKTAMFGLDANWGRIITAAGYSGEPIDPDKVDIYFGPLRVCRNGLLEHFSESRAKKILSKPAIILRVDLHRGNVSLDYYTCDFSFDYVKINASYRS